MSLQVAEANFKLFDIVAPESLSFGVLYSPQRYPIEEGRNRKPGETAWMMDYVTRASYVR